MAAKLPENFPVKVTKGSGNDKVTKHAHSAISFRQLESQGFRLEGEKKAPAQRSSAPQAEEKKVQAPAKAEDTK